MLTRWLPSLERELRSGRGTPAFFETGGGASLQGTLSAVVDETVSLGERFSVMASAPSGEQLLPHFTGTVLLTDIEVLFSPQLRLSPLSSIRRACREAALIVAWPGRIAGGRVLFSLPGRADHVDEPARGLIVLRPTHAPFPDDPPYTLERYPS